VTEFYTVRGQPDQITLSHHASQCPKDGTCYGSSSVHYVDITDPERIATIMEEGDREYAEQVKAMGHDCWEHPVHSTFRSRGGIQDAYHCGICDELLQVG
jgi:hypothetical protein